MCLKQGFNIKKRFKGVGQVRLPATIGFKVALWYAGFFILSSALLFMMAYYYFSSILVEQDREEILQELTEISSLYAIGGIHALDTFLQDNTATRRSKPLFMRIANAKNETIHLFSPGKWKDFNLSMLEKNNFCRAECTRTWIQIASDNGDYVLDIKSSLLTKGHWVQVGMSSQGREKVLLQFHRIFLVVMVPLFILGLGGGLFLSRRILQPLRHMIRTVRSIDIGKETATVPRTMSGDELDELAGLFNGMLGNIHRLVAGMKNALDNVAHDLRTPMTRLRNISEMALREKEDVPLLRAALEKGIEESDNIIRMLNTLMDISEAETGSMTLQIRRANVSDLVANIADMYQFVAEEKGIRVQLAVEEALWAEVDAGRISQALANIVDNAIKFTPAGGTITLEAFGSDTQVIIKTRDTGSGISPDDLSRIWRRLYRGDASRSEKGLGLGLSLVKGIINAHKGRIQVESKPGKGAVFVIHLKRSTHSRP
ncbi:MAG: HAMP domain-containing histidine kinase [Desulfobacterium sp.]|nr:HAMP domain-containing histidine kinase [Desulfobacterium sp.]